MVLFFEVETIGPPFLATISVTPKELDFGEVEVGRSATQEIVIKHAGGGPLRVKK